MPFLNPLASILMPSSGSTNAGPYQTPPQVPTGGMAVLPPSVMGPGGGGGGFTPSPAAPPSPASTAAPAGVPQSLADSFARFGLDAYGMAPAQAPAPGQSALDAANTDSAAASVLGGTPGGDKADDKDKDKSGRDDNGGP